MWCIENPQERESIAADSIDGECIATSAGKVAIGVVGACSSTVQDSYDFCGQIELYVDQYSDTIEGSYMCSFDVTSLFISMMIQSQSGKY